MSKSRTKKKFQRKKNCKIVKYKMCRRENLVHQENVRRGCDLFTKEKKRKFRIKRRGEKKKNTLRVFCLNKKKKP